MGEAKRRKLRGEYPVNQQPSLPTLNASAFVDARGDNTFSHLLDIHKHNPAYEGLFVSFIDRDDGEIGLSLRRIRQIIPANLALPTGKQQRSLFFHDGDTTRTAMLINGEPDHARILTVATGANLSIPRLLKVVSASANDLEDKFPGNQDNVLCFLVETNIRDTATSIEAWNAVGLEYGLGTASHEQFWDIFDQRLSQLLNNPENNVGWRNER